MDFCIMIWCFLFGSLLLEVPSIIKQIYIEKTIKEKYNIYYKSKNVMTRRYCAFYGYCLEELKNDKKWNVRLEVCRKGYNIKEYLNDSCFLVRREAHKQLKKL